MSSLILPLAGTAAEGPFRELLLQLVLVIVAARAGALLARSIGQPAVVGEITAGLVLGPSVFGAVLPEWSRVVFGAAEAGGVAGSLASLSQLGLVFLMFLIGLEFDFAHVARRTRVATAVSIAGIVVPFTLGYLLAGPLHARLAAMGQPTPDPFPFALFLGTAMSITAIPILGRILVELGMQHTMIGATVIASAACDDCVGWMLLATVSALATGQFDPAATAGMVMACLAFVSAMVLVMRPLVLPWLLRIVERNAGGLPDWSLSLSIAGVLVAACISSRIGIFAIFGGFLVGASLSGVPAVRQAFLAPLKQFVTVFFLPIFFTHTGLRTDIGTLASPEAWGWAAAVFGAAVAGKWGGCGGAAWLSGMRPRDAACVGVLMNTRALMELVVINVGISLGVIPPAVACMLVLMALGTTFMATPIAVRLLPADASRRGEFADE